MNASLMTMATICTASLVFMGICAGIVTLGFGEIVELLSKPEDEK